MKVHCHSCGADFDGGPGTVDASVTLRLLCEWCYFWEVTVYEIHRRYQEQKARVPEGG